MDGFELFNLRLNSLCGQEMTKVIQLLLKERTFTFLKFKLCNSQPILSFVPENVVRT